MAKWKSAALITTLVLPLAVSAGGEGVAMASQARPDETTIKIHKQIRYDDTISGLADDEKYFAWNHGSDEDGQHYFWGDGTEANKDTLTSDGKTVSSNNPFDWTNYTKASGKDEYTVDYTRQMISQDKTRLHGKIFGQTYQACTSLVFNYQIT